MHSQNYGFFKIPVDAEGIADLPCGPRTVQSGGYQSADDAKHMAAKLFGFYRGIVVKPLADGTFTVEILK